MDLFFLPAIYFLTILLSGITTGLTFDHVNQKPFLINSGVLFGIFAVGQFIFRVIENSQPERIIGQFIFFTFFLIVIYVTRVVKDNFLSRKEVREETEILER